MGILAVDLGFLFAVTGTCTCTCMAMEPTCKVHSGSARHHTPHCFVFVKIVTVHILESESLAVVRAICSVSTRASVPSRSLARSQPHKDLFHFILPALANKPHPTLINPLKQPCPSRSVSTDSAASAASSCAPPSTIPTPPSSPSTTPSFPSIVSCSERYLMPSFR